jgi:hypothetical protein
MSQVGAALAARDLGTIHPIAVVVFGLDVLSADRLVEAGPAGAGLILGIRVE